MPEFTSGLVDLKLLSMAIKNGALFGGLYQAGMFNTHLFVTRLPELGPLEGQPPRRSVAALIKRAQGLEVSSDPL